MAAENALTRGSVMRFVGLLVQISDRLAFGAQGTNVLPGDDLTSQAVNLVALRRRPATKILHAFQQSESKELGVFADADETDRILARGHGIAGRQFEILSRAVGKGGDAADNAIDHDLAPVEEGR